MNYLSVSRVLGFTNMKTTPQIPRFIHQSQPISVWFFVFCSITTNVTDEGFVAAVLVFFVDVNSAMWYLHIILSAFASKSV
jgi:hypothetical protein